MLWIHLINDNQIDQIVEDSFQVPVFIFKHSRRTSISSIALHRLESEWPFIRQNHKAYYLDVQKNGQISRMVAESFGVHHESPQLLVILNGECVYDASHLDIQARELEALRVPAA
ncbi:MAG: bacillithiol system redox-active protein YtxJ [Saprospiraceae bacterium]|nr:bacillithiol system redox-active protein YtxJ [Saprospiraceae bacterium]